MKRILLAGFLSAALFACNDDNKDGKTVTDTSAEKASGPASHPDYAPGLALVGKSDCFQCHKVDERITGPTYREVADKYASQAPGIIPELARKIIDGGTGVWGDQIMLAHPDLSQEEAETMVKYILTLKQ